MSSRFPFIAITDIEERDKRYTGCSYEASDYGAGNNTATGFLVTLDGRWCLIWRWRRPWGRQGCTAGGCAARGGSCCWGDWVHSSCDIGLMLFGQLLGRSWFKKATLSRSFIFSKCTNLELIGNRTLADTSRKAQGGIKNPDGTGCGKLRRNKSDYTMLVYKYDKTYNVNDVIFAGQFAIQERVPCPDQLRGSFSVRLFYHFLGTSLTLQVNFLGTPRKQRSLSMLHYYKCKRWRNCQPGDYKNFARKLMTVDQLELDEVDRYDTQNYHERQKNWRCIEHALISAVATTWNWEIWPKSWRSSRRYLDTGSVLRCSLSIKGISNHRRKEQKVWNISPNSEMPLYSLGWVSEKSSTEPAPRSRETRRTTVEGRQSSATNTEGENRGKEGQ